MEHTIHKVTDLYLRHIIGRESHGQGYNLGKNEFDSVDIFKGKPPHETVYFFYSNVLAIWHGLSADIRDTKVNYGRYSAAAILNLMGLTFFKAYPHLKLHILV